ncbi:hypothetical protein GX48_04668 [Paracoccidioides brasiliensis]|nr:hypothetical protein GX48_04668 [Paracoccidioides brasiliensis]
MSSPFRHRRERHERSWIPPPRLDPEFLDNLPAQYHPERPPTICYFNPDWHAPPERRYFGSPLQNNYQIIYMRIYDSTGSLFYPAARLGSQDLGYMEYYIMIQEPVFDHVTVYFNFRRFLTGNPIYPTSTSPLLQTHSPSSGFPLAPRESHYRLFSILKKRAKTHSPSTTTSSLANLRGSRFQSNGEDERLDGFVSRIMFVPHIEVVLNAGRFVQQRRRGRPRNREWNGVYSLDQA